jgi:hypothetical protein
MGDRHRVKVRKAFWKLFASDADAEERGGMGRGHRVWKPLVR